MANSDTKTEQMLDILANGGDTSKMKGCCNTKTQNYILDAADRIQRAEDEIEEMKNNPDVFDIVDTYQDLEDYDKSTLTDKDVIRVLNDETHDGESTYYRYSTGTGEFTYIGTSKQYTDFVGTDGQDAGEAGLVPAPATTDAGKFLNADGTWKDETTYFDFVGTTGVSAGVAGLVPAPATTDAGKFLKADGTWDNAGGSNVVQTTGDSQTDVMSQDAVTNIVFADHTAKHKISIRDYGPDSDTGDYAVGIGSGSTARGEGSVSIGLSAQNHASGMYSVTIGNAAKTESHSRAVAVGNAANAAFDNSVALGTNAKTTRVGEVNVGADTSGRGYNSTNYRVIGGVHDGQLAQDAATVNQVNATIDAINTALNTNIPHIGTQP